MQLGHEADGAIFGNGRGSSFFGEHRDNGLLPNRGSVGRVVVNIIGQGFKKDGQLLDLLEGEPLMTWEGMPSLPAALWLGRD